MMKLIFSLLALVTCSGVAAQDLTGAQNLVRLNQQQIDSIHNSDYYPRQYNHIEDKIWTICSCDSKNFFNFTFWNFSFDKSTHELKISGHVKDSRTGKPFEDLRIFLGSTEGLRLIAKNEFEASSKGTFSITAKIEEIDELYFYTYDVLQDGYFFHPLESFYLHRLFKM